LNACWFAIDLRYGKELTSEVMTEIKFSWSPTWPSAQLETGELDLMSFGLGLGPMVSSLLLLKDKEFLYPVPAIVPYEIAFLRTQARGMILLGDTVRINIRRSFKEL
jgi:hypothetical protein